MPLLKNSLMPSFRPWEAAWSSFISAMYLRICGSSAGTYCNLLMICAASFVLPCLRSLPSLSVAGTRSTTIRLVDLPSWRLWKSQDANNQEKAKDCLEGCWKAPLGRAHVLQEPEAIILGNELVSAGPRREIKSQASKPEQCLV